MNQFFILDPNAISFHGHYFEYDKAILNEWPKKKSKAFFHINFPIQKVSMEKFQVVPFFKSDIWPQFPILGLLNIHQLLNSKKFFLKSLLTNFQFLYSLIKLFSKYPYHKYDIIFAHSFTSRQLLAFAIWLWLQPNCKKPQLKLLLRYTILKKEYTIFNWSFKILEKINRRRKCIDLFTDSTFLTKEYQKYTSLSITTAPIPHTLRKIKQENSKKEIDKLFNYCDRQKIIFTFLGNPRKEKGFFAVAKAIIDLQKTKYINHIYFILQCHKPENEFENIINKLSLFPREYVTIIKNELQPNEYNSLLQITNIALIPYSQEAYSQRTSGVFTEIVALGKIPITTKNSWMGKQLDKFPCSAFYNPEKSKNLIPVLIYVIRNYKSILGYMNHFQKKWCAFHNPSNFIKTLINKNL